MIKRFKEITEVAMKDNNVIKKEKLIYK